MGNDDVGNHPAGLNDESNHAAGAATNHTRDSKRAQNISTLLMTFVRKRRHDRESGSTDPHQTWRNLQRQNQRTGMRSTRTYPGNKAGTKCASSVAHLHHQQGKGENEIAAGASNGQPMEPDSGKWRAAESKAPASRTFFEIGDRAEDDFGVEVVRQRLREEGDHIQNRGHIFVSGAPLNSAKPRTCLSETRHTLRAGWGQMTTSTGKNAITGNMQAGMPETQHLSACKHETLHGDEKTKANHGRGRTPG